MPPLPRPTPEDSLFAEGTHRSSFSQGTRRKSFLTLSGLDRDLSQDEAEAWEDEGLEMGFCGASSSTRSSKASSTHSSSSSTHDPLSLDATTTQCQNDAELAALMAGGARHPDEEEACRRDAEIAQLMARQWQEQDRKRILQVRDEGKVQLATTEEQKQADRECLYIWLALMAVVFGALAIRFLVIG